MKNCQRIQFSKSILLFKFAYFHITVIHKRTLRVPLCVKKKPGLFENNGEKKVFFEIKLGHVIR